MTLAYDNHVILLVLSLFLSLFVIYRLWRFRGRPIVKTLIISMTATGWWSFCVAFEHMSLQLSAKIFWVDLSYFGIVFLPLTWLIFALQYTNKDRWLTRVKLGILAVIPLVSLVLVWTNGLHHLVWRYFWLDTTLYPPNDVAVHALWWWVLAIYSYILLLLGMAIFINHFFRNRGIDRKQVLVLLVAMLAPWIANILYASGVGMFLALDPTPLAFSITGLAFYWGLSQVQLLDIAFLAYEEVFRSLTEGVIITDIKDRVVDINPVAQKIFNVTKNSVAWSKFGSILNFKQIKLTPALIEPAAGIYTEGDCGQLHYGVRISTLYRKGRPSGHVITLHEDTETVRLVNTDSTTGLYNNRHFYKLIEQEIARCSRLHTGFAMLMLDLDFFKTYNDNYGHQAGNTLLLKVGECIMSSIRAMDSAFRYGGEEFAVILPETNLPEAYKVAERIRKVIRQIVLPKTQPVTASIGISGYPADGTSKEEIISRADAALYLAKHLGRNRTCLSPELSGDSRI